MLPDVRDASIRLSCYHVDQCPLYSDGDWLAAQDIGNEAVQHKAFYKAATLPAPFKRL